MTIVGRSRLSLDEYVEERSAASDPSSCVKTWFGPGTEGEYVDPWRLSYRRLGFFAGSYVTNDADPDACVIIEVPATDTGVMPTGGCFGWTGRINRHIAELAVWWAFDLASENEARSFLVEHRPTVMFRYFEGGSWHELDTSYDSSDWIVTRAT